MRVLLAVLAVATLATACSGEPQEKPKEPLPFEPAGPDAAPDPSTFGPFPVGVRTVTLEDPERPDKTTGLPRRLVTEIWYPATEAARNGPPTVYDIVALLTPEDQAKVAGLNVPKLTTTAVRDAAPRTDRGPYPLVVFGHGQGAIRWQSTFYTVTLASHGYVVIATDHAGSTLPDLLASRDLMAADSAFHRPLDKILLLDWALSLPAGHFLDGMIDAAKIGVTGHSFGAFSTLNVGARDPRVKAIVPQAPPAAQLAWIGLPPEIHRINVPVMIQAGRLDQTLPWDDNIVPTWRVLQRPRWLVDMVHAGHFTFSDLCAFDLGDIALHVGFDVGDALEDGCTPPAPEPALATRLINHFAIGFFNAQLRASPGSAALVSQAKADALAAGEITLTAEP